MKGLEMAWNFLSLLWNSGWEADTPVKPRNNGATYFNSKRIMCIVLVLVGTMYDLLFVECIGKFQMEFSGM
jgi:hypothetical protein